MLVKVKVVPNVVAERLGGGLPRSLRWRGGAAYTR
jgi:hypothetical protein